MHIDYLADHPELIPKLARLHFDQWGHFRPAESLDDRTSRLAASCGRGGIPTVVVALDDDGELAGGAMLVENDMETRPDLTPWLAGVYVAPARRGHGHASALVTRIEAEAASAGVERLYLYTPNAMSLYARLGWAEDERCRYRGEEVAIMSKCLTAVPATQATPGPTPDIRVIPGPLPDAISRVTELHALYYHREWGFGRFFEAKVATELAAFLDRFDEERDGFWTALTPNGRIEGAIAIDGAEAATEGAHLRWFVVSDALRGQGVGGRLMETAMDFCRSHGYERVYLWTFEGLDAARHLYDKHGFKVTEERRGKTWGREVLEQRMDLRRR